MPNLRDFQRSKVYDWENKLMPQYDKSWVKFADVRNIVHYVWAEMGLEHPPLIRKMHKNRKASGTATGMEYLDIPERGAPTWMIIHEIAHSMSGGFEDEYHLSPHGEEFVGMYMVLLEKFLNVPLPVLWHTASKAKIKYTIGQKPLW